MDPFTRMASFCATIPPATSPNPQLIKLPIPPTNVAITIAVEGFFNW